jgi:hypothetical protein
VAGWHGERAVERSERVKRMRKARRKRTLGGVCDRWATIDAGARSVESGDRLFVVRASATLGVVRREVGRRHEIANSRWRRADGGWRRAESRWRRADGGEQMADGGEQMAESGWRVVDA